MPPSFAIVSLLAPWSVASDHTAHADSSLVSSDPSRTSRHSGAIAPVRAMAAWLSTFSLESVESAPAAFVPTSAFGAPRIATRGPAKGRGVTLLINEVRLLSVLHHKHVVRFRGAYALPGHLCILLEYCPGGSLETAIAKQRERFKRMGDGFDTDTLRLWLGQVPHAAARTLG